MFLPETNLKKIRDGVDFTLNRILIVFFFCILMVYASREIVDLDLWLHLKTGQYITAHGIIPSSDIFSFTLQGRPWINHEWLFQVLAYLFYATAGADGLIIMQNIILIAAFMLLLFSAKRDNNHIFVFIILYLTLLTCSYRFTIRPDIFSLFFLTAYLCFIKNFTECKASFFITALSITACQIAWANMHGFYFLGPLVILIFLLAELAKRYIKLPASLNQVHRLDDNRLRQLLLILGLTLAACMANPYGLKGAAYPFSVLGQVSGKGRIVFQYIQELARPITLKNILDVNQFFFYKALIFISLFSFRFNRRHINISDLLLWLLFTGFSLIAIRNVAYFAFVAAFVTFNNVELAFEYKKGLPKYFNNRAIRAAFCYALMACLVYFPAKGAQKYLQVTAYDFDAYQLKSGMWGISKARFPEKAVDFLLTHDFPKRIFNDFNSGSYLIGRAFPQRQVFIDGRTELYGPDFFTNYVAVGNGDKEAIGKILNEYGLKGFFLTTSTDDLHMGLARYLLNNPLWITVYFDEKAIILLKDIPENSGLISRFKIDLSSWTPPEPDYMKIGMAFRYPLPYVYRARFLNKQGFYEAASKEARAILNLMPNNAEAFKFLADYYFENKDYKEAFVYIRNSLIHAPGNLFARARLALIYYHLKEDEKALKVADALIKNKPKFAEGYYTKALILIEKDREAAKALLHKATELAPKEPRYKAELDNLS
ncbi:MAG TPA: hypothetical protein DCL35_02720 [Candidatus Omnitrophica bacterium]|nr:hypothetical protein [Candidatus Omnitrophota bacterium]